MTQHSFKHSIESDPRYSKPIHDERSVRIIVIGAGISGLLLAYKIQRSFRNFTLTLYDKNADVSGTWTENRYPGCACDVPAHTYTYSFLPNPDFSHFYSSSAEIKKYLEGFVKASHLEKYIKPSHLVTRSEWDNDEGQWNVDVRDLSTNSIKRDSCNILINAGGFLNEWEYPKIEGFDTFQGELIHTANWPSGTDLRGKRVGLIGNGSSAIQVLPAIQPEVSSMTIFIRSPTWIAPPAGIENQREFTAEEKERFKNEPGALLNYRKNMESLFHRYFDVFLKDSEEQKQARQGLEQAMTDLLKEPGLAEKLIPKWSVGCRRLTPGPGFLEAIQKPNVNIVHGDVAEVVREGCKTASGDVYAVDVLIFATGFNTSFRPRFPIIGLNGVNLQDEWDYDPRGYMAIGAASMPNYLTIMGPNSPTGNGPVIPAIEAQADYVMRCIDRYQTENIRSFSPKQVAINDFNEHVDNYMWRTVWNEDCRSWYKNHSTTGRIIGLWPGSTLHFLEAMRETRWDDWDIQYKGNRFAWLGDGHSQCEADPNGDKSYYTKDEDTSEHASKWKKREALGIHKVEAQNGN